MNENKTTYTKLKDLVDDQFTIEEAYSFKWKMWSPDTKRMLVSDDYMEGYRKVYAVKTDKGVLDLGPGQIGNLLEAVYYKGDANLINKTFKVKSNGKTGMDIRYFFNPVKTTDKQLQQADVILSDKEQDDIVEGTKINLDEIPF